MSLLNHFEVSSRSKATGSLKGFCKHCPSSITYNNMSYLNLTTYRKVNVKIV